MKQEMLLDALVQAKRMAGLLNEVLDYSQQLGEALNRNDQVSMRLVLSMREEPIAKLKLADRALMRQRDAMPEGEEKKRFISLLNGEPSDDPQENMLATRMEANKKLLARVVEIDKVLNRKIAREKSIV
jgi:hypothetical protein